MRFSSIFEDAAAAASHIKNAAERAQVAITAERINHIVPRLRGVDDWPEVRRRVEAALVLAPPSPSAQVDKEEGGD